MFSAGPANSAADDDPYGFDVDFSSKRTKKPSYNYNSSKKLAAATPVADSDSDEDVAAAFAKNRTGGGKGGGGGKSKARKGSTSGSALDRASKYLTKYKKPGKEENVEEPREQSLSTGKQKGRRALDGGVTAAAAAAAAATIPDAATLTLIMYPTEDFDAFMESSADDSPKPVSISKRRSRRSSLESSLEITGDGASRQLSRVRGASRKSTPNADEFIVLEKFSGAAAAPAPSQTASPTSRLSLGNTIKGKLSSPVLGVLKSASDVTEIYKETTAAAMRASDPGVSFGSPAGKSFVSDTSIPEMSMEESIAEEGTQNTKIMTFDQLEDIAGVHSPVPSLAGKTDMGKTVKFRDSGLGAQSPVVSMRSPVQSPGGNNSSYGSEGFDEESNASAMNESADKVEAKGNIMSFDMLVDVAGDVNESVEVAIGKVVEKEVERKVETTTTAATERKPAATTPAAAADTVVRPTVIVAKAYEAAAEHVAPLTRDAGTQFNGNHAGVQADLAPSSMYGTSSCLDARFTVEMEGGVSRSNGVDVPATVLPGRAVPRVNNFFEPEKAASSAYLELLKEAKGEAEVARRDLERFVMVTEKRGGIQPAFAKRSQVFTAYEEAEGKKASGARVDERVKAGLARENGDVSGSFASYNGEGSNNSHSCSDGDASEHSLSLSASASDVDAKRATPAAREHYMGATAASSLFGTKVSLPEGMMKGTMGLGIDMEATGNNNTVDMEVGGEDLSMQGVQNLFRRQLEMVRKSVAAARVQHARFGMGAGGGGGMMEKEREEAGKKKKKASRKEKKKRGAKKGIRVIKYWEALMKVDPSLSEKEAKRIAKSGD